MRCHPLDTRLLDQLRMVVDARGLRATSALVRTAPVTLARALAREPVTPATHTLIGDALARVAQPGDDHAA